MTPEEAIKTIQVAIAEVEWEYPMNYSVAFETAIEALKKQIPEKPIGKIDPMFGDISVVCPNCENTAIVNPFTYSIFKRCPNCGQALDCNVTDDYFKNYNKEKEVGGNNNA